jgi:hypothetical protein
MPINKINVADGRLADWHRFDAQDKAVVKDRSFLMAVSDSTSGAIDELNALWTKLGNTETPPRVISFNRHDVGQNRTLAVPGAPSAPTIVSADLVGIAINLSFAGELGGAPPTSVDVRAVSGVTTYVTNTAISWPWPSTAQVVGATAGTWSVSYRINNTFGTGTYSPATSQNVPA